MTRRLAGAFDALALHAALADRAARQGGATPLLLRRTGGRALVMVDSACRIEATGPDGTVRASSENGEALLAYLVETLAGTVTSSSDTEARFAFARCEDPDEAVRMADAGALALLRAATSPETHGDPFALTALGIVGFDHVDMVEALPAAAKGDFPDLVVDIADTLVVIEASGAARIVALHMGSDDDETAYRLRSLASERLARLAAVLDQARAPAIAPTPRVTARAGLDDARFEAIVETLKDHVAAGDIFQAVPSRRFSAPCADPLSAFRRLVAADPSAYHFYADTGFGVLLGASPENALEIDRRGGVTVLSVSPIAGTRPRGVTADADDRMEAELRLDAKEVSEHLMLVDLARNDVARVAKPGTRRVASLLSVERFAKVMHLVSRVEGELDEGRDAIDAIRACLNVGTLSGAPKLKAIELIRRVEDEPRGPYGGAIFSLTAEGELDSAVVIRAALVRDGEAEVRAGAGVVADSDPAAEAAETRAKASAILAALGAAA